MLYGCTANDKVSETGYADIGAISHREAQVREDSALGTNNLVYEQIIDL